ncbi:MAG: FAD-dependent oxidoreductase [Leptolyngbyaceae cyanobacterium SM1_1_3]|nr:FAD-dependent oxidoreductase [Leptolyngbyaceae cyanobacterium SM1_1_3]
MTGKIATEIVVIGAGLAGLSCAQQLAQAGYQVIVLEKSRASGALGHGAVCTIPVPIMERDRCSRRLTCCDR